MRVMFVASPLIGHLFPMMPLAVELRRQGNSVLVATGGDAVRAVDGQVRAADVGAAHGYVRGAARGLMAHPLLALRSAAGLAEPRGAARVFAATNAAMRDELTRKAIEFEPDVVVHEPFASVAAIVAARLGVPAVLHNIAFDNGSHIRRELLRLLGAAELPESALTLSVSPPSLVRVPGRELRFTPYATADSVIPEFLREPAGRPRILVTRSTMLGDGPDVMLASILRAAPRVDAEIVIVRPNHRVERAPRLPANVRTVGWTDLHSVLPHCTAMVNHAGAGSVYAALRAGVPQLATPAPGDRRWNARLVHRRGVGLSVPAWRIRAAHLTALSTDPGLAEAAREVAAEIAAMPGADRVAAELTASIAERSAR
ncbi:glycosyltransferase [Nocardia inohanensis]|uniref:glycosyltransferase n=1 Tax=Nocardia inohanensis TaxID=209246 RepID=UPI00082D8D02|nr:glycosyltransferase [Nocardia inohanensis]